MKAKMSNKVPEQAIYSCLECNNQFRYKEGKLVCPRCKNTERSELVPVFMRNDRTEESLYTSDDWHGG